MAIVLPDGLLKNKNARFVRKWIEEIAEIKAVISLPEDAFNSYGAMVKTSLCVFGKFSERESARPGAQTLLLDIENLGYDATGRARAGSEIEQAASAFHALNGWAVV